MTTLTKTQPSTNLLYNRQVAAAVLSWDARCYSAPELHIRPDDITGISIDRDVAFYQVNETRVVPLLIEDFYRCWDAVREYSQERGAELELESLEVQPLKNYEAALDRATTLDTYLGAAFNWIKPDAENEIVVWASRSLSLAIGLAPFCFVERRR